MKVRPDPSRHQLFRSRSSDRAILIVDGNLGTPHTSADGNKFFEHREGTAGPIIIESDDAVSFSGETFQKVDLPSEIQDIPLLRLWFSGEFPNGDVFHVIHDGRAGLPQYHLIMGNQRSTRSVTVYDVESPRDGKTLWLFTAEGIGRCVVPLNDDVPGFGEWRPGSFEDVDAAEEAFYGGYWLDDNAPIPLTGRDRDAFSLSQTESGFSVASGRSSAGGSLNP